MKKVYLLFFVAFFGVAGLTCSAQQTTKADASKKTDIAAKEEIHYKRIKVDLERLPNSILVSLRDSYAKHFVTQAFQAKKNDDVYFVELRKGRSLFTVAVDNNGRVLKEIRDGKLFDRNTLANKN